MPSMLKKAMLYLGLGSDEDFEAFDQESTGDVDLHEQVRTIGPVDAEPTPRTRPGMSAAPPPDAVALRSKVAPRPEQRKIASAVRPLPAEEVPADARVAPAQSSVVRPVPRPRAAKPQVVSPVSFNDAQEVADHFKRNQPVIVNLQQAPRELTRRLIDFASGLCYGVGGSMKKVSDAVYLLTPTDVEVSDEERARLQEAGLHD